MVGNTDEQTDRYLNELVTKALETGAIQIGIKPIIVVDFTAPNLGTIIHDLLKEISGEKTSRIPFQGEKRKLTEKEFEQMMIVGALASIEDADAISEHERLMDWSTNLIAEFLISKPGTIKHNPRHWSGSFEQTVDGKKVLIEFEVVGTKKKNKMQELTRHIKLNIIPAREDESFPNTAELLKQEIVSQAEKKGIDISDIDLDDKTTPFFDRLLKVMKRISADEVTEAEN